MTYAHQFRLSADRLATLLLQEARVNPNLLRRRNASPCLGSAQGGKANAFNLEAMASFFPLADLPTRRSRRIPVIACVAILALGSSITAACIWSAVLADQRVSSMQDQIHALQILQRQIGDQLAELRLGDLQRTEAASAPSPLPAAQAGPAAPEMPADTKPPTTEPSDTALPATNPPATPSPEHPHIRRHLAAAVVQKPAPKADLLAFSKPHFATFVDGGR
ncbi:MAG: hypothetical protein JO227_12195 [Acetobacteraceae bacterium]|nr:hypothetical protein [Acetobacteraceae bacterium]